MVSPSTSDLPLRALLLSHRRHLILPRKPHSSGPATVLHSGIRICVRERPVSLREANSLAHVQEETGPKDGWQRPNPPVPERTSAGVLVQRTVANKSEHVRDKGADILAVVYADNGADRERDEDPANHPSRERIKVNCEKM